MNHLLCTALRKKTPLTLSRSRHLVFGGRIGDYGALAAACFVVWARTVGLGGDFGAGSRVPRPGDKEE